MDRKVFSINRLYFILVVSLAIWSLLIWNYNHGGVPSHHLLAREDLPEFSNWWGGLLLPLLTWFLLHRIQKREVGDKERNSRLLTISKPILYRFIGALLFGIVLSVFFTLRNEDVPFYMMIAVFASTFFVPVYRAECLLGFVFGMTYTFGGVLPILIGSILVLLSAILYLLVRPAILFCATALMKIIKSPER